VASILTSLVTVGFPGDGHVQQIMTALLLGFVAWRSWRTAGTEPTPSAPGQGSDSLRTRAVIAVGSGSLAGFLGVGGGIVMVPAFQQFLRMPVKKAIGTSLVCVGVFGFVSTISHWAQGNIDWRFALWLTVGVIPGAWLGAWVSVRAKDKRLQQSVAAFLGVLAVVYAAGELIALTG
jgi:uncharacterized protein